MHHDPHGDWVPVRGVDISTGGMLVETAEPVAREASVSFRLSNHTNPVADPWELQGRVVRIEPSGRRARRLGVALKQPVPDSCLTDYILGGRHRAGGPAGGPYR